MNRFEVLLGNKDVKKVKELRLTRFYNLTMIRTNMDEAFERIKRKKQLATVIHEVPQSKLKMKTLEILEKTCEDLKRKIELDLPIDQDDVDFAVKLDHIDTPARQGTFH